MSRLPPEALSGWLAQVSDLLGVEQDVDADDDVRAILDLTRDVSATVVRPAGPLTMFLIGLALGGRIGPGESVGTALAELEGPVRSLAERKGAELTEEWRSE